MLLTNCSQKKKKKAKEMNLSLEKLIKTGKRKVRKGKRGGGRKGKQQQPPDDHDISTSNIKHS